MTKRIARLKESQWAKRHHAFRTPPPAGIEERYRGAALSDVQRTALRLKAGVGRGNAGAYGG